jgi:hypothetical protein
LQAEYVRTDDPATQTPTSCVVSAQLGEFGVYDLIVKEEGDRWNCRLETALEVIFRWMRGNFPCKDINFFKFHMMKISRKSDFNAKMSSSLSSQDDLGIFFNTL